MTGSALSKYRVSLHAAIDREADGQHLIVVSGGTTTVQIANLDVTGTTASVSGRSLSWIVWVDPVSGASARPEAWDTFTATLGLTDGVWLVSDLSLTPENSGP